MTKLSDKQVLERCIELAIEGGWKSIDLPELVSFKIKKPVHIDQWPWYLVRLFGNNGQEVEVNIEHIIFNHDFAKALFGEETEVYNITYKVKACGAGDTTSSIKTGLLTWQYHLQQMVISPNPIDYLRTWLEENK